MRRPATLLLDAAAALSQTWRRASRAVWSLTPASAAAAGVALGLLVMLTRSQLHHALSRAPPPPDWEEASGEATVSAWAALAKRAGGSPPLEASTTLSGEAAAALARFPKSDDYYRAHLLPAPQLDFGTRPLLFQMHNCNVGRVGVRQGLTDAGFRLVPEQATAAGRVPVLRIFDDAVVMVACNSRHAAHTMSQDPRVLGKRLVSTIVGFTHDFYCLGSGKTTQLLCRREFARRSGCAYEELDVQPPQYAIVDPEECRRAVDAGIARDRAWVVKPSGMHGGSGIKYFPTTHRLADALEFYANGSCAYALHPNSVIQEYVSRPALLNRRFKFDVRTWLLVASVDPLVVFHHDGFARVAKTPYSVNATAALAHITNLDAQEVGRRKAARQQRQGAGVEDEEEEEASVARLRARRARGGGSDDPDERDAADDDIERRSADEDNAYLRNFATVSAQLQRDLGFPPDYMRSEFRDRSARAAAYVAVAQFIGATGARRNRGMKGAFHLFACDWVVAADRRVHLLECNGLAHEVQANRVQAVNGEQPPLRMWGEMMALVLNLHTEPHRLMTDAQPPAGWPGLREYPRQGVWANGASVVSGDALAAGRYSFGGWRLVFNEAQTPLEQVDACAPRSQDELAGASRRARAVR